MRSGATPGQGSPTSRHGSSRHQSAMVIWLLAFAAASAVALTSFSLADGKIAPAEQGTVSVAEG